MYPTLIQTCHITLLTATRTRTQSNYNQSTKKNSFPQYQFQVIPYNHLHENRHLQEVTVVIHHPRPVEIHCRDIPDRATNFTNKVALIYIPS